MRLAITFALLAGISSATQANLYIATNPHDETYETQKNRIQAIQNSWAKAATERAWQPAPGTPVHGVSLPPSQSPTYGHPDNIRFVEKDAQYYDINDNVRGHQEAQIVINGREVSRRWQIDKSRTLQQNLTHWGNLNNWEIVWNVKGDYPIGANATFEGDFIEAAANLSTALKEQGVPLHFSLYTKNRVLEVNHAE